MNSKTVSNYVLGAVAGVGLTIGSVAFAVNTTGHHNGTMGTPTQQTIQDGMHGQTSQKTFSGMHGQTGQGGMNGQITPDGMHNGMVTGADLQNTPCHATTDSKDTKS